MGDLLFRDLGPLLVESDGVARPVGGARLEAALALLLIHAGRPVGIDALIDAVWGDAGVERSASTLDSHVWRLRRRLEPGRAAGAASAVLVREPGGYRLAIGPEQVDSLRCADLAERAAAQLPAEPDAARRTAEEALRLWRGRPFGRNADDGWARAAVARLDEIRGALRETHVAALLATGSADRALAELETLLDEEPLRERLWAHRITAYRLTGRRSDAMAAYAEARSLLVTELGVEPGPELAALHAELLRDEPAVPAETAPPPTAAEYPLPAPRTRLIGRDDELTAVLGRLGPGRLVTLVGTAGAGKTRLAVEVARAAAHADGVCFVDLTVATPGRVLETVASTLGQPFGSGSTDPLADLGRLTAARRMLLVLDNCEHVLNEAAELVDELLGSRATVLATSREPLALDGEEIVPLEPLTTPAAVELFLERLPAPTPDDDVVREIVAAVDRLPLALELAAGRARAYTLAEIATQVRADAGSLSRVGRGRGASHHRTVFDAVDTSYRDLPAPLAALHRAVGAVPGPFTADLAAGLLGRPAVDDVAGLVHRSLLSALGPGRPGGASRFAQFATVRGHAVHSAERAGEDPAAARDAWIEGLVRSRPRLGSAAQAAWYHAVEDDLAALRATLQHTLVDAPSAAGPGIAGRLDLFWAFNGMPFEGRGWLDAAARALPLVRAPHDRALLHLALGSDQLVRGQLADGRAQVRAAIAAAAEVTGADAVPLADTFAGTTGPLRVTGQADLLAEVAAAVRTLAADRPELAVVARHAELVRDLVTGPKPALIGPFTELHDRARADDNQYTAWSAAAGAARLLLAADRPAEALPLTRAALHASARTGLRNNIFVLEIYGTALARTGEALPALRAFGAAEAQHRGSGRPWPPNDVVAGLLTELTGRVGAEPAERARTEGARTSVAQLLVQRP